MTLWLFSLISLILRLYMLKEKVNFPVIKFLTNTVFKCVGIFLVCILPMLIFSFFMEDGVVRFFLNVIISEVVIFFVVYSFGLNSGERQFVIQKMHSFIK